MSEKVERVVKEMATMSDDSMVKLAEKLYGYDDPWWRAIVSTNIQHANTIDELLRSYDGKRKLDR